MKLTQDILDKINEIHKKYPNATSVGWGKKIVNGVHNGEYAISISVANKKPLSELKPEEVIESKVNIGGVEIPTDINQQAQAEYLSVCGDNLSPGGCGYMFSAVNNSNNRATNQIIMGGISVSSDNNDCTVGTLGGIVRHTASGCVVGLTNRHVTIGEPSFTAYRDPNGLIQNEFDPPNRIFQTGEGSWNSSTSLGVSLAYTPAAPSSSGQSIQCDAALVSIEQSRFDTTIVPVNERSWNQQGLQSIMGNNPPPFATTNEIDNLEVTNPRAYSTGRTLGPKGLMPNCPMVIVQVGVSVNVPGNWERPHGLCPVDSQGNIVGTSTPVSYDNIIKYAKPIPADPNNQAINIFEGDVNEQNQNLVNGCYNPVWKGDSGSFLLADINGTVKIVGLVFAGSVGGTTDSGVALFTYGFACRIDKVAEQLGIEAYVAGNQMVDPSTIEYKTINGLSSDPTITCDGEVYSQMGLTNSLQDNC